MELQEVTINGGTRRNLGVRLTEEQMNDFNLVQNKIACAEQALTPARIPEGTSDADVDRFVRAAIAAKAAAITLQQRWWRAVQEANGIPFEQNTWVDFNTRELYVME